MNSEQHTCAFCGGVIGNNEENDGGSCCWCGKWICAACTGWDYMTLIESLDLICRECAKEEIKARTGANGKTLLRAERFRSPDWDSITDMVLEQEGEFLVVTTVANGKKKVLYSGADANEAARQYREKRGDFLAEGWESIDEETPLG